MWSYCVYHSGLSFVPFFQERPPWLLCLSSNRCNCSWLLIHHQASHGLQHHEGQDNKQWVQHGYRVQGEDNLSKIGILDVNFLVQVLLCISKLFLLLIFRLILNWCATTPWFTTDQKQFITRLPRNCCILDSRWWARWRHSVWNACRRTAAAVKGDIKTKHGFVLTFPVYRSGCWRWSAACLSCRRWITHSRQPSWGTKTSRQTYLLQK